MKVLLAVVSAAITWLLLLALVGLACLLAGVYLLAGVAWTLILLGAFALGGALFIGKGL